MKLLGSLFILLATTWIGFDSAKRLTERTRQLRQLKVSLQSLEAEIMYGHTPLQDASLHIAKQAAPPLSNLFTLFSEKLSQGDMDVKSAWESSLLEIWPYTSLKEGELEVLKQFGETLGQHDLISQQKHIKLTMAHLEKEEKEALFNQEHYGKMTKSLGFLAGLLIIILLM
ncbi:MULTISPECIES: stage III sporulation protein SpoIIIAB [Aeribacillus]|jgi:stage III sporulation protein AB|uniref:stage III sporulation protein SpoIIIAB n=1 Tax=Aeribacillus TaxID=1055323 RepID=UPI0007B4E32F|nr:MULTISPECIES: stage III sporulation protein SpoIIIAB [Aeribacillus]KZM56828.1 stage III sporulation protein SpoAB [Aeribacillus pallidus]MED0649648.1 stage III sporulation protein SpoIIIAB [Aeribacillus composti]MED0703588.1 stage III sporulation protein SpoIIIAB [Aeribacillus composti]MED0715458.1 stage III sporulation protein SpoIIIAB [Aeribacillus composti]MED0746133.1 stage III sporulation protein SpoIIIAB [Aeribacillus composti]